MGIRDRINKRRVVRLLPSHIQRDVLRTIVDLVKQHGGTLEIPFNAVTEDSSLPDFDAVTLVLRVVDEGVVKEDPGMVLGEVEVDDLVAGMTRARRRKQRNGEE